MPRLIKAGYEVPPAEQVCQLCEQHIDTLHHRLFQCQAPEVCALRREFLPARLSSWLEGKTSVFPYRADHSLKVREQHARELASQGLARDPSVGQPPPASDGSAFEGELDVEASGHLVFPDGSCTRPFHTRLARASWAVAFIDNEGQQLAAGYGPVWKGLPQSAPCAETVAAGAIAAILGKVTDPFTMVGDNQAVVNIVRDPPALTTLHKLRYAGLWRSAYMKPGWGTIRGNAEHIRSHQIDDAHDDLQNLDQPLRQKLMGNKMADEKADEGQTWHQSLNKELVMIDSMAFKAAQVVVALAGKILPLHPRRARHQRRAAEPEPPLHPPTSDDEAVAHQPERVPAEPVGDITDAPGSEAPVVPVPPVFPHIWVVIADTPGTWRCTSCGTVANTGQPTPPSVNGCMGLFGCAESCG